MATKEKYIETIGRRKTASARVRLTPASKTKITILVNEDDKQTKKKFEEYFPTEDLQAIVKDVFKTPEGVSLTYDITAVIKGGGISAQAQALRHGIARAIVEDNTEMRHPLKTNGYLKRDPRMKERKKPGLKKARRAPQWSKR